MTNTVCNSGVKKMMSNRAKIFIIIAAKSRQVYFLKRSMSPGYSGVDNLLFYQDNVSLIFGDAKDTIEGMVNALKGGGH